MRRLIRGAAMVLVLLPLAASAACSALPGGPQPAVDPTSGALVGGYGRAQLIAGLNSDGFHVSVAGDLSQPFLSAASGKTLQVSGANVGGTAQVQAFEYSSAGAAQGDAQQFQPDGSTKNTMIDWIAPPHLYQRGRVLAIYVGTDAQLLAELEKQLGKQFAGR
jgi:hypothetical protein